MENASKALLIAGSVLIAIIIISLLVKTYRDIGKFKRQQYTEEQIKEIEEFNKEFIKYDGQYVHGTDVITVINRAAKSGIVTVEIQFYGNSRDTKFESALTNEQIIEIKEKVFKCDNIEYDNNTGKVNKIHFQEIEMK